MVASARVEAEVEAEVEVGSEVVAGYGRGPRCARACAYVLTHLAAAVVVDARSLLLGTHLLGGKGQWFGPG